MRSPRSTLNFVSEFGADAEVALRPLTLAPHSYVTPAFEFEFGIANDDASEH